MGVAKREGLNGSAIEPIYSHRKMKCYSITESELKQINLANIGITAFFSIGSTLFAFAADIFKDSVFGGPPSAAAKAVMLYLQPVLILTAILFWIFAAASWWWRWRMIELIKNESGHP